MLIGLDQLIAPINRNDFITDYLGKEPLLIKGKENKTAGLFNWTQASSMLTYTRNMEGFRLVHETNALEQSELPNYKHWLQKGATLVINNIDQIHESVFHLANSLELDLNTKVNVNCYLSYPSVQAFKTHYDQHDVFAIQLEGTKKWVVYESTDEFPTHILGKHRGDPPEDLKVLFEIIMSPGDVLYIPRGYWHHAIAETPSIHLTVGPSERTPIHFLRHTIEKVLHNDAWFRSDFPLIDATEFGGKRNDLDIYFKDFQNRLANMFKKDAFKESFIEYIQTSNTYRRSDELLTEFWDIENIVTPETKFRFNPNQKYVLRYDDKKKVATAMIRGKVVNLVGVSEDILQLIFDTNREFSGEDIMNSGDLSWEKAKAILITMYRETISVMIPGSK